MQIVNSHAEAILPKFNEDSPCVGQSQSTADVWQQQNLHDAAQRGACHSQRAVFEDHVSPYSCHDPQSNGTTDQGVVCCEELAMMPPIPASQIPAAVCRVQAPH